RLRLRSRYPLQALLAAPSSHSCPSRRLIESGVFYSKRAGQCQARGSASSLMTVFNNARLLRTVAELSQLPPPSGREVAFAGRSNAGKSSAINTLTRRRKLAYVA